MRPCHRISAFAAALALTIWACGERAQEPVPVTAPSAAESTAPATAPANAARAAAKAPSPGATVKPPVARAAKKTRPAKAKTPEVPFEGRRIALVHTANVVGELEPCG